MASLALAFDILARDNASKTFRDVGDAAEDTGKKGGKLGPAVAAGVAVAGVALVKFGKDSVSAFVESEQSSLRLDEALRKFPATADVSRASLDELNESLAKKTKFDDDATASGEAVLAQFGLTGKQIMQLTPLLQDYAAKTGKDLPEAAGVLGKALLGKGKALAEVGIQFKDAGSKGANFEQITKGLRTQVGGFAEKEGQTAAGKAQILGNRFGEVQEKVGSKLVPALTDLADKLVQVIDFVERNSTVIGTLVSVIGTAAAGLLIATKVVAAFNAVSLAMGSSMTIALGPVGLVIIAIAALAAGLVFAYKNSETFRNIVNGAFHAVVDAADWMKDKVVGAVAWMVDKYLAAAEWIVKGAAKAFGWVPGLGDKLKGAADAIERFRDDVNAKLRGINPAKVTVETEAARRSIASLKAWAESRPIRIPIAGVTGRGGATARAEGGPVTAGMPYWVGERGPELVIPPRDGHVLTASQSAALSSGGDSADGWFDGERRTRQIVRAIEDQTAALRAVLEGQATLGRALGLGV